MGKGKKKSRRKARTKARHFGDNPKIRHSHKEHTGYNPKEPWEAAYRKKKFLKRIENSIREFVVG